MTRLFCGLLVGAGVWLVGCAHGGAIQTAANCDPSAQVAEELALIDEGERVAGTVEEAEWTPAQRQLLERASALLESHERPVTGEDLAILNRALDFLASEAAWDRADDRNCAPTDTTFSLFCALQRASVEVLGAYQHRRTALQEVRFALEEVTQGRAYEHRLRDFNNDPATTLADARGVIVTARDRIAARLQLQNAACR